MAVFPEQMKRLDPNDVKGSMETLDRYIRYMCERIEFAMSSSPVKVATVAEYHQRLEEQAQVMRMARAGAVSAPLSGIEVTTSVGAALARKQALKEQEGEGANGAEEEG